MRQTGNESRPTLSTYPPDSPVSRLFRVRVDGEPACVYHTNPADFVVLTRGEKVHLEIEVDDPITTAAVRPRGRGIESTVDGTTVRFDLDPPANLSVEIDDLPPLFIYANAPQSDIPSPDDPKVTYFAGGRTYEAGEIRLESGQTLYIEGGAVVKGNVRAAGAADIAIRGHGILDGAMYRETGAKRRRTVLLERCGNVRIEDIAIINPSSWTVQLHGCNDVHVRGLREIGEGLGTDGIDVVACRNVVIEDCMLRNGDDCVVIKAFNRRGLEQLPDTDVHNVLVRNCVLLNVRGGNAMEIGHELPTESVRNITFRDIDVLCVHGHGAVFSIGNADCAAVKNILYENIRVEHYYAKLLNLRVIRSRYSKQQERGHIRNVHFRNVRVTHGPLNEGYSISLIAGYDEDHRVEGVRFEDFYMNEKKVRHLDDIDCYTKYVSDITFA